MPTSDLAKGSIRFFRDRLAGPGNTSRIGILVLTGSLLAALIGFLMNLKDARELMTKGISLGLRIEPEPTKIEVQGWFFFVVSLGMFVSLAIFLLWVQAEFKGRSDHTVRTLRGVMRAAGNICQRLFPPGHLTDHTYEKIHFVYQIQKDFTTLVRRTYQVRAGASPIYFVERIFRVRDFADSADSFIDIDFKVRDIHDPNGVVYVPLENERRNKSACIFFLPRIEPGAVRTFEISYKWPKMTRSLRVEGEEEFAFRNSTANDMAEFCLEIYLEPGSGGALSWEESGHPIPNKSILEAESQLGWPGVIFSGTNIPPAVVSAGIRLRLRWKVS
jgi:hypothetical protein